MLHHAHIRRRRGFTLTEIAIVLALIGLILGGVWTAASNVMRAQTVAKAAQENFQILTNFRKLYAQRANDTGSYCELTCIGIQSGFFPYDISSNANCSVSTPANPPLNPCPLYTINRPTTIFGGWSTTRVHSLLNPDSIIITYDGVPRSYCASFLNAITQTPEAWGELINGSDSGNTSNLWGHSCSQGCSAAAWTPTQIKAACDSVVGSATQVQVWYTAK